MIHLLLIPLILFRSSSPMHSPKQKETTRHYASLRQAKEGFEYKVPRKSLSHAKQLEIFNQGPHGTFVEANDNVITFQDLPSSTLETVSRILCSHDLKQPMPWLAQIPLHERAQLMRASEFLDAPAIKEHIAESVVDNGNNATIKHILTAAGFTKEDLAHIQRTYFFKNKKFLEEIKQGSFTLQEIQAHNKGLIKTANDSDANELDLQALHLSDIQDVSKTSEVAPSQISKLYLACNRLHTFEPSWVQGYQNIKYLCISHNRLKQLTADMFSQLPKLSTLDVSYNKIHHIEPLQGLSQLEWLRLNHNKLETFDMGVVANAKNLRTLNLARNKIQKISDKERKLETLDTLCVHENPLTQDNVKQLRNLKITVQGLPKEL